MISWAEIKKNKRLALETSTDAEDNTPAVPPLEAGDTRNKGKRVYPKTVQRVLRQRELGSNSGRSWMPSSRSIPDELKEHVFDDVGPRRYFKGTSSDVTCLAWAPDGKHFAAASIAITDDRSMQYNKPDNLLLGNHESSLLAELPEHHIPRPHVKEDPSNPNGLSSMRETQDPRLFMTVASVQFSPDSRILYSAGRDQKVRAYEFERGVDQASCKYELDHPAPLDLMSVSNTGIVATACHQSTDGSIGVYNDKIRTLSLSPSRVDTQTERAIYPSALRWGVSYHHSYYLLAGFSIDSIDDEREVAGETCLWDIASESRVHVGATTRNVFDIAWNPAPSSTSHIFAVACTPGTSKVNKRTRSIVQCFAPRQSSARRVLELECPAFDINDVIYCPYDTNLIAVGATDSKVYLWDQRFAGVGHQPLHTLQHGDSLSVLDHDRDQEIADTGIRFLSWGATSSRLYSGSSDGVVKLWNPYSSTENAHVKDVATFTSAVMSGAFSPDHRELLIGEDQGRLNSLSVGFGEKTVRSMERFDFHSAPLPKNKAATTKPEGHETANELLTTGQIELKSMGALPIRQAVQGPNYRGPYLAPSDEEIGHAEQALKIAQDEQNVADARASAMFSTEEGETENAIRKAQQGVENAQERIWSLEKRASDAEDLVPRAEKLQKRFRKQRKDHKKLLGQLPYRPKSCGLDCNYLPASIDDDAEVPDSLRSESRIPTALRSATDIDTGNATPADLIEAGLSSQCRTCGGPAPKPKSGKLEMCARCFCKSKGFTSSCEICASPVRPNTDTSKPKVCERCSFGCFRCGKPKFIARSGTYVTCDSCDLTWKAGVLGYELVQSITDIEGVGRATTERRHDLGHSDEEYLGNSEIEHYASLWQTSQ
jgi:WD40 repeat protein